METYQALVGTGETWWWCGESLLILRTQESQDREWRTSQKFHFKREQRHGAGAKGVVQVFELEGGAAERVPSVQAWGLAEAGWNLRILDAVPLQGPDSTGRSPRWPAEGRSDPIPGFKEVQGLPSEGEAGLS